MKIAKNTVVTVHYKLSDAQNNMLEDGQEPIVYLHGGYDDTLPALEKALDGQDIGYKTMIQVEPEDAFGEYDSALLKIEQRELFPEALEIGMQFEGIPDNADPADEPAIYVVTGIVTGRSYLTVTTFGGHRLAFRTDGDRRSCSNRERDRTGPCQ